jgi:FdhE protein
MSRPAAGFRTDTSSRLAELRRQRPEWEAWLKLVGEAEEAVRDDRWSTAVDHTGLESAGSANTPLLHGCTVRVNAVQAQQLLHRLAATASAFDEAGSLRNYRPSPPEALQLLSAAVQQDGDGIAQVARARELDAGALTSVAHLAALPLLRSAGRALQQGIPKHWPHGYCPICAAWPIFAERRGLDRSRRLRCGRCAAEWEVEWLYCIYCNERNHEQLGSLEPEGRGEILKVETCATCMGYLKSLASLQGFPEIELLLQDLETVELDLVALDRGYRRPSQTGFPLNTHITGDATRNRL